MTLGKAGAAVGWCFLTAEWWVRLHGTLLPAYELSAHFLSINPLNGKFRNSGANNEVAPGAHPDRPTHRVSLRRQGNTIGSGPEIRYATNFLPEWGLQRSLTG